MIDLSARRGGLHATFPVRLAVGALLLLLVLGTWIPAAGGQSAEEETSEPAEGVASESESGAASTAAETVAANVTSVDALDSPVEVSLIGVDPTIDVRSVSLTVDGEATETAAITTSSELNRPTELIVVVDVNVRGATGDVLSVVKERLAAELAELPSETAVAVIAAGDSALIGTNLTTDRDPVLRSIEALSAKNGSALFNAVDRAGALFSADPTIVKSMLIISTGSDTASDIVLEEAQVGVVQKGAQIVALDYRGGEPALADAVARTAGVNLGASTPTDIAAAVEDAVALAAGRLIVSFVEPDAVGARVGVEMTVDGVSSAFSYPAGVLTSSSLQLSPIEVRAEQGFAFFRTSTGLYVTLGLAFVGITLGVWSLGSIMAGGDASLEGMLARYTEGGVEQVDGEVDELIVQSALLQRAVDFSESFAAKRGFLARVEDMLERANLPVRAGEGMFILSAIVVLSASFGLVVTRSFIAAGLIAVFATGLTFFVVRLLGRRRFKTFESQLPDTLQLLSGTLRAGYSLPQGLEAVSNEIADPMGQELRRAMTEARLGRDIEESLGGIAERLSSPDFAWTVMAISIQREVGGNLNELLMSVADTMIARERLKREIAALTAEGRVSAAVLSFLPPGLGLIMYLLNPGYVALLFSDLLGNIMLGLGVVSALVGLAWMKKVITVDV